MWIANPFARKWQTILTVIIFGMIFLSVGSNHNRSGSSNSSVSQEVAAANPIGEWEYKNQKEQIWVIVAIGNEGGYNKTMSKQMIRGNWDYGRMRDWWMVPGQGFACGDKSNGEVWATFWRIGDQLNYDGLLYSRVK
jgi:hypothetical protein